MSSNDQKPHEGDVRSGAQGEPITEKPVDEKKQSDDEKIDEDEEKTDSSQHSSSDESDEETKKQKTADKDPNKIPTAKSASEVEQEEKQKASESKPAAAADSNQKDEKQSGQQSDQPTDSKSAEQSAEQTADMDYDKYDDKMLTELMRRNSTTNTVFEMKNKLESANFEVWRELFEARMRGVHLFQLIDPDQEWEETETKTSQWRHLDTLAKDVLKMNVDEGIRSYIRGEPTARAMYLKVIEQFQGSTVIRGWRLCKELCDLLIHKRDQLDQIAVSFNAVSGKLTQLFPTIPAMFLTSLYCAVLPPKYDYILSDVLQASEGKDIDYKEIVKLTMAAHSRNMESSNSNKKILSSIGAIGKVDDDQSEQTADKPKNSNRRRRNKNAKGQSKNANLFCDYCKRSNHDDTFCFFKSRDVLSGKIQIDQPVNSNAGNAGNQKAKTQQTNREQFIAAYQLAVCGSEPSELDPLEWYLDSCAGVSVANSVRGLVGMLCKMEARLLDYENRESRVQGVGTYHLVTETGAEIKLTNVIYKASSAASYLSLGQLMKTKLFRLAGEDDWLELYSKATGKLVLRAIRMANSNTYKIQLKAHPDTIDRSSAIETDGDDMRVAAIRISPTVPVELKYRYWHCVLCHCSFGYLVKIAHLLGINEKLRVRLVCDVCTMTKAAKLGFSRSEFHATAPFELVHADLSGIVRVANLENVSYFLLLIDDFSRYISVFLLGRKYQVADCYEEYLKYLDVQFGAKVKCLRTDNGTEFKNERMNELTIGLGTVRQYSAHGNPQQNGRAERPMRTIAEMARAILKQKGLSMRFWPYVILYAVFLKNRLPHSALDFDIPFHKLFGELPELKDIIQFGVLMFVLDLNRQGKLADRARPAIFLGYPEETKGFYVYLIDERKVDITRDIYTSEQVFGSPVKTETTYSVDPNDADISMDPEHPLFSKPLCEEERETIDDQVREQLESTVVLEEDLDEYSTADYPNNSFCSASDASFYSASSEPPETMNVRDESEQSVQQVVESEQADPAGATEVATTERPLNENAGQNESSNDLNNETPAASPAEAAISNDQPNQNEKAKLPFLGDLIDTKQQQHNDYPRGEIVMNKSERAWFKRVFPDSKFVSQVPYKQKGKGNHKLQVVNVAAIQAPRSYDKAMSGPHRPVFQPAMDREMAAQIAAGSFELVERPKNEKILPTVWLYRYQFDSAGQIIGGKARLVVLGNQQTYQIGENNYAPVVNMSALRTTLAIAASRGMHTHHIDCKTAFLNSEVDGVAARIGVDDQVTFGVQACVAVRVDQLHCLRVLHVSEQLLEHLQVDLFRAVHVRREDADRKREINAVRVRHVHQLSDSELIPLSVVRQTIPEVLGVLQFVRLLQFLDVGGRQRYLGSSAQVELRLFQHLLQVDLLVHLQSTFHSVVLAANAEETRDFAVVGYFDLLRELDLEFSQHALVVADRQQIVHPARYDQFRGEHQSRRHPRVRGWQPRELDIEKAEPCGHFYVRK